MMEDGTFDTVYAKQVVIENEQGQPAIVLDGGDGHLTSAHFLAGKSEIQILAKDDDSCCVVLRTAKSSIVLSVMQDVPDICISYNGKRWSWREHASGQVHITKTRKNCPCCKKKKGIHSTAP